jgi:hypothetical protein
MMMMMLMADWVIEQANSFVEQRGEQQDCRIMMVMMIIAVYRVICQAAYSSPLQPSPAHRSTDRSIALPLATHPELGVCIYTHITTPVLVLVLAGGGHARGWQYIMAIYHSRFFTMVVKYFYLAWALCSRVAVRCSSVQIAIGTAAAAICMPFSVLHYLSFILICLGVPFSGFILDCLVECYISVLYCIILTAQQQP